MSEKKKILYISETMVSGVLSIVSGLANALADTYDITIAYGLRPDTPPDLREQLDSRVQMIPVKNFTRELSPGKDVRACMELRRIVREVKPDLIHLHSSKAGALGRLVLWEGKTPMFYTPHGYSFLMQDASPRKKALYFLAEWVCARRSCTTISCSPGEHQQTLRLTRRAQMVNNGIDMAKLDAAAAASVRREHPFTVCMLGRIGIQKNPDGFRQIAETCPDVQFVWIGDGELRSRLSAPNITVTGWLDRIGVIGCLRNADAFLLPSLWEGLPVSLLEAMYLGLPCIVSDVIGNRDVIRNGVNGYVCRTLEEYAAAIADIRSGGAAAYVKQAGLDIRDIYNTEVQCQEYRRIYAEALQGRQNRKGGAAPCR